jgi:hypothetical protein
MNKLSDLIPLIVIVVSILLSITGKKKKTTARNETMLPGKEPGEPWQDVTEMPEIKRNMPQKSSYKNPAVKQPVIKQNPIKYKEKNAPKNEVPLPEVEADFGESFVDVSDVDEIRKAIIYSEIFNKKEY